MFLWEDIAFGPIKSRRLGSSFGINILPTTKKVCSFDCIYCECGWTLEKSIATDEFPPLQTVNEAIEHHLQHCKTEHIAIDSLTFAGNGEPTLHPDFGAIIDHLIVLRDKYYPKAVISCLSNSTQLLRSDVKEALLKIENPILKLDAVTPELFALINKPTIPVKVEEVIEALQQFKHQYILQTLFFRGEFEGTPFDNGAEPHLSEWLKAVALTQPKELMLYSLDRATPAQQIYPYNAEELAHIKTLATNLLES